MDIVIIPAYEPDEKLIELTKKLIDSGFSVLVVDDGSGEKYSHIFSSLSGATVISHDKNRGKGAALKTGMRYINEHIPNCEHFITCDADGQHSPEDVTAVRERLHLGDNFVLTVRNKRKGVPLCSKIGNDMSRFVYALLTSRYLSDNQSGLRGFSRTHLQWLLDVEKDNYDYEMNVLYYAAKKGVRVSTIPIEAIYIGNNESSHFDPVGDTIKIYKSLFRLSIGGFISFLVAEIMLFLISLFMGYQYLFVTLPSVAAICYLITVMLNKNIFFKHTHCYDYLSILIYTVIEYLFYTLICMLFSFAEVSISLFLAFNITYFFCIPLRYFLHKFIFIASQTRD